MVVYEKNYEVRNIFDCDKMNDLIKVYMYYSRDFRHTVSIYFEQSAWIFYQQKWKIEMYLMFISNACKIYCNWYSADNVSNCGEYFYNNLNNSAL